ncbi:MAG: phytanoyl-CoA dioxygenase family protein [Actinomycetota bacterium]|nr:phytanoyl-CoA dioxygenase family protein [Actinomycetota bacterium]
MSGPVTLDERQLASFRSNGYLVVPGFYHVGRQIEPLRRAIHEIIGLVAADNGLSLDRGPYTPEAFDDGYLTLKAVDRTMAATVYDAVKQLSPFVQLMASPANEAVVRELRGCKLVGVAAGGSGIRIDNPDETKYLAWWHQDYPAQLRSRDGIVFWSPLREVTPELGPVEILPGSHGEGVIPVVNDDGGAGRKDAYALRLRNESEVVSRYRSVAPLSQPGDLVLIDYLTVHRSGFNRSDRPRWTVQLRYFDFEEATGRSIGWAGSFAAGNVPADIHPELGAAR